MLRRYPVRLQHKVIVGPLVIWDFVRSRAVVLPSSEPGAAGGGQGECQGKGGGGVRGRDPEPSFKRMLFLPNTNIYFEYKVVLKVRSKNSENGRSRSAVCSWCIFRCFQVK